MVRLPWRRAGGRPPALTGVWARQAATSAEVLRRTAALGTAGGEVGALLSRADVAGRAVAAQVARRCADGCAAWPDDALQVPADPAARAAHDAVRDLVAAQRAVLHRATLLTMPGDPAEHAVLLRGLTRAVRELERAAG